MTTAQKTAKDKFKKAIEYRKKTGVSLKEAFAYAYGKKVGAVKKKGAPNKKAVVKKAAPKKKAAVKKVGVKKVVAKKVTPVKVAPVKKTVKKYNSVTTVSGTKYFNDPKAKYNYGDPNYILGELLFWQNQLDKLRAEYKSPERKQYKMSIKQDILLSKKWVDTYKKKLKDLLIKLK
jgi:hypothetical protein